jgi:hypothetical protein
LVSFLVKKEYYGSFCIMLGFDMMFGVRINH